MTFQSSVQFREPDAAAYETQKQVRIITLSSHPLPNHVPVAPLPMILKDHSNGALEKRWEGYFGPRLNAAAYGARKQYVTFFPGHTVPGPGAGGSTWYRGSLAIERFEKLLSITGGFPPVGNFKNRFTRPKHNVSEASTNAWPWKGVPQPKIRILNFGHNSHESKAAENETLISWLRQEIEQLMAKSENPAREILSLVRMCWDPFSEKMEYKEETLKAGNEIMRHFKIRDEEEAISWLSLAFELEYCLSLIEYSKGMNMHSYGEWNGCWVEVGDKSIEEIQCTELVQERRVLTELVNIRTRGFAPIIINELGCDTDGTHRITAAWLWNLLQRIGNDEKLYTFEDPTLKDSVARFIAEHKEAMGPLVIHETLRALAEFVQNPECHVTLHDEVLPHLYRFKPIVRLPVLLLLEYSCGAVIKGPYDEGVATYRVDPTVYGTLAKDKSCALPARGPYHLTDRVLLPWFTVLERR